MTASSGPWCRTAVGQLRENTGFLHGACSRQHLTTSRALHPQVLPCGLVAVGRVRLSGARSEQHTCWVRAGQHSHGEIRREVPDHTRFNRAKVAPVQWLANACRPAFHKATVDGRCTSQSTPSSTVLCISATSSITVPVEAQPLSMCGHWPKSKKCMRVADSTHACGPSLLRPTGQLPAAMAAVVTGLFEPGKGQPAGEANTELFGVFRAAPIPQTSVPMEMRRQLRAQRRSRSSLPSCSGHRWSGDPSSTSSFRDVLHQSIYSKYKKTVRGATLLHQDKIHWDSFRQLRKSECCSSELFPYSSFLHKKNPSTIHLNIHPKFTLHSTIISHVSDILYDVY